VGGDTETKEIPEEVYDAIREYLEASGRWETIRAKEYVFAKALSDVLSEMTEEWRGVIDN
jgi:hypothetical protein